MAEKPVKTGEKQEERPGFCSTAVLANLFDVSDHWIGDLTRAGVLRKHDTSAGGRYNVVEATRSYCRYLREKIEDREDTDTLADKEAEKLAAEVQLKTAKAEYAEMELEELQGRMHRAEDVEAMMEQMTLTIRKLVSSLPARLAATVAEIDNAAEAAVAIRRECNIILEELAAFRYSREILGQLREELGEGRETE